MTTTVEEKAKSTSALGVFLTFIIGSGLLIFGVNLTWGIGPATIMAGALFMLLSGFFFVAFKQLI